VFPRSALSASRLMQCYRHPRVETGVSCGRCDRPICPKCMVAGPAGMRCPDCASLRTTALYRIAPSRLALALFAGLITGIIGAFLMSMISFFVFFVGPLYGGVVAEAVLRAAGRKRGRVLEVIGVGSIVLGALLTLGLPLLIGVLFAAHGTPAHSAPLQPSPGPAIGLGMGMFRIVWPLIGFGLAVSACYARLKYL
jgi:hypothetical protein